jgi:hypothetical protein
MININHDYKVVIYPYNYHHINMKLIILRNNYNGQVLPISEGNHGDLNQQSTLQGYKPDNTTHAGPEGTTGGTSSQCGQRDEQGPPHPSAVFHAYASADTPWVAHALSHFTPVRYGRIASVSAAHEVTQFAGPHKIPYAPVHNSNLLIGARRSVLNRHRRGLPPWSFEFQIRPLILPSHPVFSISP